ncbi:hypothetical protein [Botryobacter ruber]|uniref:hypothetical protein n=1 Tax=Botryobacter ruber TaxID=2171629 RepID=UPI00196AB406|nr:hypothetical protein [Botryobacter ruber]
MKKVTVLAAAIALFGFTAIEANAQTQNTEQPTSTQQPTAQAPEEQREKVTQESLPAPVQEVLKQDALKDWQVSEIYKIAAAAEGEKTQYEVFFTNAQQEKAKIRVDETGAIITDKPEQTNTPAQTDTKE